MPNDGHVTTRPSCYHADCDRPTKWGIASSVEQKNPDGSDLTLYACGRHYTTLTLELRGAGTRYTLFPVGGPHMVSLGEPRKAEEAADPDKGVPKSLIGRALFYSTVVVVGTAISPFILAYYAGRWVLGWRP